ncbi:MAG TPA: ferrous iron transporter B [Acidobacteria bacterium]|nr:ferrous iron transporter B [Acidobacteriota bacterium]
MSLASPSSDRMPASPPGVPPAPESPRVALLGNPNTGKTTLFNRLCGVMSKTANFPGTTTRSRIGRCVAGERTLEVVDLPGAYRLSLGLPESKVCRAALLGEAGRRPDLAVVVLDATNLARNLILLAELAELGVPAIAALNMVDLAQQRGLTFDRARLSELLGCPVVPVVARRGDGVPELREAILEMLDRGSAPAPDQGRLDPQSFPSLEDWTEHVVAQGVGGRRAVGAALDTVTERLDQAFTHPLLGTLVFLGVMAGLFWTLFVLASVPMDLIEATFRHLGDWTAARIPPGAVRDLLVQGVIGGIAGSVVFLPQICLLFFLLSLLEDTGYLARAAFVMDRLLCRFGLPGHAFVPLLSSHACAVPGILSTPLIPDRQDRLTTILVAPLMSCSARVPVYVFLTSLLFADSPLLAGLAFSGCYLLGATAALVTAAITRRTILRGPSRPMVLELPSYKAPSLRNALLIAFHQGVSFLRTAGTVIMAICLVMWWLSAYPRTEPPAAAVALQRQAVALEGLGQPERAAELSRQADLLTSRHAQAQSFAGRLGRTIEPVFAPLGYDWQLTVGVLTSFLAREVFVSTMAVLLQAGSDDVESAGVLSRIRTARRDDGRPIFTRATSASLLVFFVLAMQCLSTLVVTRRESGSWRWAALQLGYMTTLAYLLAFATFQGLQKLGIA